MKKNMLNSRSLLPAFLLLFGAFLTSTLAFAQAENEKVSESKIVIKSSKEAKLKKTISVEEVNGEKVVTVTTETEGNKNVEKYVGQEADDYLEKSAENMISEAKENGFEFKMDCNDEENVQVIMMQTGGKDQAHSKVIWVSDEADSDIEFSANSINVNNEDGIITMDLNYTGADGEEVAKMIVFNETEIVKSLEEMQELLEDMDVQIDMNITTEGEGGKEIKTVIVTKKIVLDETSENELDDLNNSMFQTFSISTNLNRGQIQLDFETINKGKGKVSVLDINGNLLFMDSFNGKSPYTKNITISDYHGIAILKIEQDDKVEVRKLMIE